MDIYGRLGDLCGTTCVKYKRMSDRCLRVSLTLLHKLSAHSQYAGVLAYEG